ncbi:MAG: endolytic transglycosylase MltG [Alcaligenaceae bacterium]|nr:endolytic transglycosylase MltG [Alcaligenaceae bacterium]
MKRFLKYTLFAFICLSAMTAVSFYYFIQTWQDSPVKMNSKAASLIVKPHMTVREVTQEIVNQGVDVNPALFIQYMQWKGFDRQIKAGAYKIDQGDSPNRILEKLTTGEFSYERITFIEGLPIKQWIAILQKEDKLKHDLPKEKVDDFIKAYFKLDAKYIEGWFYPDTYSYVEGDTDLSVLQQAHDKMKFILDRAWKTKPKGLPYKTKYEALIMASIIQKETSKISDMPKISGVFVNRLKKGMRLQTDPTVIYGMGDKYKGNIRRRDLRADNAWNTYTRAGLPISPICNPGLDAINASLNPTKHPYYYFSAKGVGQTDTIFSKTLREHNKNVRKYLLNKKDK